MVRTLFHSMITFIDLLALTCFIGAAWCYMWSVWPMESGIACPGAYLKRLKRVLAVCMAALVISSAGNLIMRAVEMSGVGFTAILPVLNTVIFKTHFGAMWLVRLAGLSAAWVVWLAGKRSPVNSRLIPFFMLCTGAVIAFSRSASGHPADFGDLSRQQFADWLHLLSAASWGGVLFAAVTVIRPAMESGEIQDLRFISGIADRFYLFFGPALAVQVFSGLYTAWFQVGSFPGLTVSPYGRVLSIKLALLIILAFRYIAPPQHGKDISAFVTGFLNRMRVDAIILSGVLLCAAMLTHEIPARHFAHLQHAGHSGDHPSSLGFPTDGPHPNHMHPATPE